LIGQQKKTWMPGTRPGLTKTAKSARGLLERHCAIGKSPLLVARLCSRPFACQYAAQSE
jgi:hypothetical protein